MFCLETGPWPVLVYQLVCQHMNVQSSDDLPPSLSVFASLGILPVGVVVRVYEEGKRRVVMGGFVTDRAVLLSASTDISKRCIRGEERLACLGVFLVACTSLIPLSTVFTQEAYCPC